MQGAESVVERTYLGLACPETGALFAVPSFHSAPSTRPSQFTPFGSSSFIKPRSAVSPRGVAFATEGICPMARGRFLHPGPPPLPRCHESRFICALCYSFFFPSPNDRFRFEGLTLRPRTGAPSFFGQTDPVFKSISGNLFSPVRC